MRKIFLMVVAALMATMSVNAQARFEPGTITLQPRVGCTGTMITNMPNIGIPGIGRLDREAIGGLIAGVDAAYQVNNWLEVATGVNYAQAGSGWKDTNFVIEGLSLKTKDVKIRTHYINVPIIANLYIVKGFALKTGVQLGFLTSAKATGEVSYPGGKDKLDESCKDDMNTFDVSIPVGISYEFSNHIVLDARYNVGLTKVNKEEDPEFKNGRNFTFALTIGYKFEL